LQTWNLVDSGKHMDYINNSKYNQIATAINKWNSYKPGIIRKDTLLTINDVTLKDVNTLGGTVVARTYQSGKIEFAKDYMDTFGSTKKLNVCIHEIGHALGLDHRNENDSVMYPYVTSITTLSQADKVNYDAAYKTYYKGIKLI
jgi:Predicted Zn-dependent proteases